MSRGSPHCPAPFTPGPSPQPFITPDGPAHRSGGQGGAPKAHTPHPTPVHSSFTPPTTRLPAQHLFTGCSHNQPRGSSPDPCSQLVHTADHAASHPTSVHSLFTPPTTRLPTRPLFTACSHRRPRGVSSDSCSQLVHTADHATPDTTPVHSLFTPPTTRLPIRLLFTGRSHRRPRGAAVAGRLRRPLDSFAGGPGLHPADAIYRRSGRAPHRRGVRTGLAKSGSGAGRRGREGEEDTLKLRPEKNAKEMIH
eukprot:scaffold7276_cov106-Isochrysis_galbana.AAC.3